jgi:hypothetical protein
VSSGFDAASEPRTIVLAGNGSNVASYKLAPGVLQYVQSVLVEVDATGAGSVRPTLRVQEQSGVVIATKRQGQAIPAGDTGTATWALRLTDETIIAPGWQLNFVNQGPPAPTGEVVFATGVSPQYGAIGPSSVVTLCPTWTVTANDRFVCFVQNDDTSPIFAQLYRLYIQRLDVAAFAAYSGNAISVPGSSTGFLDVTTLEAGAPLLNIANPTLPKMVATGIYAFTLTVVAQ